MKKEIIIELKNFIERNKLKELAFEGYEVALANCYKENPEDFDCLELKDIIVKFSRHQLIIEDDFLVCPFFRITLDIIDNRDKEAVELGFGKICYYSLDMHINGEILDDWFVLK